MDKDLSLEALLSHTASNNTTTVITDTNNSNTKSGAINMLKAEQSASFDDFIAMTSKLVGLTMGKDVEFVPDENKTIIMHPDIPMNKTYITYNLVSRTPRREAKPTARESIFEDTVDESEARSGVIYGRKFRCHVQFNVFASEYAKANKVLDEFEEMLFAFTGYMKSKGVENIIFDTQLTDTNYDIYRESLSVRNVRYYVDIEKLMVIFKEKVQSVIASGSI